MVPPLVAQSHLLGEGERLFSGLDRHNDEKNPDMNPGLFMQSRNC